MNEIKERKNDMANNQKNQLKEITLDDHKYVLDMVNMWINNSDSKVSVFCGLFTVAFGVIAFLAERILSKVITEAQAVNPVFRFIAIGLLIGGVFAFLVSMCFCFRTLSPNLKGKTDEKTLEYDNNLRYSIFYGDISKFTGYRDYLGVANKATKKEYIDNVIEEIHINSQICSKKMKNFRTGIWISFASLLMEIFGGLMLLMACS